MAMIVHRPDEPEEDPATSRWGDLAPELLANVVERVQQSQGQGRRVVAMAGVCRSWRRQILAFVRHQHHRQGDPTPASSAPAPPAAAAVIDFPWCLLQPGGGGSGLRRDHRLIHCLLKRKGNKFLLYQTLLTGKESDADASIHAEQHFLLAARRKWRPRGFSYIVGKDPADLEHRYGASTLGKLKSNFWASEFVLWQTEEEEEEEDLEEDGSKSGGIPVLSLRFVEHIVNGIWQRRIQCALPHPCKPGGGLSFVLEKRRLREERKFLPASVRSWFLSWSCAAAASGAGFTFKSCSSSRHSRRRSRRRSSMMGIAAPGGSDAAGLVALPPAPPPPPLCPPPRTTTSQAVATTMIQVGGADGGRLHLELRSKVPEWDPRQQCWSLDFNGRASLPSMHNFQLISGDNAASSSSGGGGGSSSNITLQLGKIAKNVYTLDFGYPLSAFQAFAICLSSFATSAGLEP